jgi:hypothetical protein
VAVEESRQEPVAIIQEDLRILGCAGFVAAIEVALAQAPEEEQAGVSGEQKRKTPTTETPRHRGSTERRQEWEEGRSKLWNPVLALAALLTLFALLCAFSVSRCLCG